MKKLNQILRENNVYEFFRIYLRSFLIHGSNSGKSFITINHTYGTGLKVVNSDVTFERGLKKVRFINEDNPDEEEYFRNLVRDPDKDDSNTIGHLYTR